MLLHDTIRGTRSSRHPDSQIQNPTNPRLFIADEFTNWYVQVFCPFLVDANLNCVAYMLREHGAQRQTVFEILIMVHRMRGTKSKFNYTVPSRFQLVPHLVVDHAPMTSGALNGLVSYRSFASQAQVPPPADPNKNAGVQAREKVLEAIAPLRRGRPNPVSLHHATTGPSSPTKEKGELRPPEIEFKDAEDESWKAARGAVRGHRSGLASPTRWQPPAPSLDNAWSVARESVAGADKTKDRDRRRTL